MRLTPVGRLGLWAFYALVLGLLAIPVFSVAVPPLADYPNHLARMHVLAGFADSVPLRTNYAVHWKLAPYLGMDLLIPPLTALMSVYRAGQVFLVLCLAQFVLGSMAVHAALFRRVSVMPAAGALFAYSNMFSLGFINYLFGVGVWLLAFAGWIVLARRSAPQRLLGGLVLSMAVFFCHFFALFGFLLTVAGYELGCWWRAGDRTMVALLRRGLLSAATLLPSVLLTLRAMQGQDGALTRYGALDDKLLAWLSFLPTPFPGLGFGLALLAGFALAGVAAVKGHVRIAPAMRLPLLFVLLALLAMPQWLSGVWGVDRRLPLGFMLLMIASCDWPALRGRASIPVAAAIIGLLVAEVSTTLTVWRPMGAQFEEFRVATAVINPGARVLAFREDDGTDPTDRRGPLTLYLHLPALAIIERDVFLPYLFKNPMMPVESAPEMAAISTTQGYPISLAALVEGSDPPPGPTRLGTLDDAAVRNFWDDWPHHYDIAIGLNFGTPQAVPAHLVLLQSGSFFNIYRVTP